MDMTYILCLAGIGLVGGTWNAVAGGATLFTFPALMALGLPPMSANATNYLALLPSNAAALPAYRRELRSIGQALVPLLALSGAGAVTGSLLLVFSDPALFQVLIPGLVLTATLLFAFGERLRRALIALAGESTSTRLVRFALFIASIYGGYFGAGLGIILLAIAQILGFTDFHVANGLKNLLATGFTLVSVLVFGIGGLIAWPEAGVMMAGSTAGGFLGARLARHVDQRLLRALVTGFGLLLSAVYFFRLAMP